MAKILLTSGGTKVPIDMVRDITNMSKGTFGARIGRVLLEDQWSHNLVFLHAKGSKTPFSMNVDFATQRWEDIALEGAKLASLAARHIIDYTPIEYRNFDDYERELFQAIELHRPDVIVLAAAVSDYGVENYVDGKVRSANSQSILLKPLPKLISRVREAAPNAVLVGFKLLVKSELSELIEAAHKSCLENGCNFVVANDLSDIKRGDHALTIVRDKNGRATFDRYFQREDSSPFYLAQRVVDEIEDEIRLRWKS